MPEILFGAALYLTYARLGIKPSMTSLLFGHLVDLRALRHPQRDGRPGRASTRGSKRPR